MHAKNNGVARDRVVLFPSHQQQFGLPQGEDMFFLKLLQKNCNRIFVKKRGILHNIQKGKVNLLELKINK